VAEREEFEAHMLRQSGWSERVVKARGSDSEYLDVRILSHFKAFQAGRASMREQAAKLCESESAPFVATGKELAAAIRRLEE